MAEKDTCIVETSFRHFRHQTRRKTCCIPGFFLLFFFGELMRGIESFDVSQIEEFLNCVGIFGEMETESLDCRDRIFLFIKRLYILIDS